MLISKGNAVTKEKVSYSSLLNMAEVLLTLVSSLHNTHWHRVFRGRKSPGPSFLLDRTPATRNKVTGRTYHKRLVIRRKGDVTRQLEKCREQEQLYVHFKIHNLDFVLKFYYSVTRTAHFLRFKMSPLNRCGVKPNSNQTIFLFHSKILSVLLEVLIKK